MKSGLSAVNMIIKGDDLTICQSVSKLQTM